LNIADEDADVPGEAMIPKYQLQDLCSEAAKLKTLGAMESVPPDRLVRLLNILEKNIRDGTRVSPIADPVSVLGWGVMLYGLFNTTVEVQCLENGAFLMPIRKSGRAAELPYSVE
jgi:hypothetical protein